MEASVTLPPDIATNPAWYLADYSRWRDRFVFTLLAESQYEDYAFLDGRERNLFRQVEQVAFDVVDKAFSGEPAEQASAYIFHTGHCGSTLLSRALGQCADVLSIREPLPLRKLAHSARELEDPLGWLSPGHWERLKRVVLRALERRFRPGQLPIIKATSTCNNLAEPILASHSGRKAIFLYQTLETTLAGMFRSSINRGDLRKQARYRVQEWHQLTGSRDIRLSKVTDVEVAVLSWAGSMSRLLAVDDQFPGQVMKLDFDDFLKAPGMRLSELSRFLGLDLHSDRIAGAFDRVVQTYSKKPDQPYSPIDRQYDLDLSRSRNVTDIAGGLRMAHSLTETHPELAALRAYLGG